MPEGSRSKSRSGLLRFFSKMAFHPPRKANFIILKAIRLSIHYILFAEVTVEYFRGLPQVTVPLPSRKERCRFTLRPISNTVGNFLDMLRHEDRGIDRVTVKSVEGVRIASSNTIEALMEDNFKLVINDEEYFVETPKQEQISKEELERLSDVRNLVNQLYEALNIEEHQLNKERLLNKQLEELNLELKPLEEKRNELDHLSNRRTNVLTWVGLGLMSVQFGILARLTWWEYSWDIMEPITYFVTYGTAMAAYSYYVLTKQAQNTKGPAYSMTPPAPRPADPSPTPLPMPSLVGILNLTAPQNPTHFWAAATDVKPASLQTSSHELGPRRGLKSPAQCTTYNGSSLTEEYQATGPPQAPEYILPDVKDRQHLIIFHKRARKVGLDVQRYNELKDNVSKIEADLRRLRDPLHIHLPPQHHESYNTEPKSALQRAQEQLRTFINKAKSPSSSS
uniref:Calcium uniporter protein n=1 Tax=Timema cristinae TaxID=61476 RepID=A0A7R9GS47_TIMCR|nr:unnamed protein product [Timema cristinae]